MSGLTINDPIRFADILNSLRVLPGDTLLLRGGTYSGDWVIDTNIKGTQTNPVTIKPYNGESVTIDGSLQVLGDYITIIDIDFTDTIHADPQYVSMGVYAAGTGFQMYGCHIRKQHASGVSWYGHGVGEISENWIEDNGYLDADGNTHGYCIYTHNEIPGEHFIRRNLMRPRREKYSLHVYTSSPVPLYDYRIFDNVLIGPVHTGGGYGLRDFQFERNIQYRDWVQLGRYLYDLEYQNIGGTIKNNIFLETYAYTVNEDLPMQWTGLVEDGNLAWSPHRPNDFNRTGYITEPEPSAWSRFIPFAISGRWAGIQVALENGVFSAAMTNK